jgi:transposase
MTQYIAWDVHCAFTEMTVVNHRGKVVKRERVATRIDDLAMVLEEVARPRWLTFEEGPMSGWLYRSFHDRVDKLVVCEPRRNHLVAKDSDKDDPIDSEKLVQLLRGGYLKGVHQKNSLEGAVFKQFVGAYHDRVRDRVRTSNTILAQLRRFGVFSSEREIADADDRKALIKRLPRNGLLRENVELHWLTYDTQAQQVEIMRSRLEREARREPMIRRFAEVPGLRWIRAATFFVHVDTPWRFPSKQALWKYAGIGLERSHSGAGRVQVHVAQAANRQLRSVLLGAAKTAICIKDNPFHDQYQRWKEEGISARNATRNVARSLAATLWGMWKNGSPYRPQLVAAGGKTADTLSGRR